MKYLDQFIKKTDALGQLRLTARQLNALTREIRAVLPAEAADHLVGCAPRPGAVVVFVDSAAWASQFRYLQQAVLEACQRRLGEQIQRVQFKILPPEPITGKRPVNELTENSRRLLKQAAAGIGDDALASALRRLSHGNQDAE